MASNPVCDCGCTVYGNIAPAVRICALFTGQTSKEGIFMLGAAVGVPNVDATSGKCGSVSSKFGLPSK